MTIKSNLFTCFILAVLLCDDVAASRCDAHYPFDGSLVDASGSGYDGLMIADGRAAEPEFRDGKYGQALHITGDTAMRSFLDLHHEACPQFTITAWFKLPSVTTDTPQTILSTGARGGIPAIVVQGSSLTLYGSGNGLTQKNAVRDDDSWLFVAATFDYEVQEYKLYWRNRAVDGTLAENPYDAEDSFWVGTRSDSFRFTAEDLFIDDVRVYGRVLGLDEIRGISRNTLAHTGGQSEPTRLPGDQYQTNPSALRGGTPKLPVAGGPGTGIDVPEEVISTQPPLGGTLVVPDGQTGDSSNWNDPGKQIANPESQAVFQGKVTDAMGQGVAGTRVQIYAIVNQVPGAPLVEVLTDESGQFTAAVVASVPVALRFVKEANFPYGIAVWAGGEARFDSGNSRRFKIEPGQRVEWDQQLRLLECTISGSISHWVGPVLPGMSVGIFADGTFDAARPKPLVSTTSGAHGEYRLEFRSYADWSRLADLYEDSKRGVDLYIQAYDLSGVYRSQAPSQRFGIETADHIPLVNSVCKDFSFDFVME
ncbi:MAG TPA: LamG domain-containing protein [Woeseiaceae bacterium]|nr:LamG domain-containing protein [Woeseiaceae bacterium]